MDSGSKRLPLDTRMDTNTLEVPFTERDTQELLDQALQSLPASHQSIVRAITANDLSIRKAAKELGRNGKGSQRGLSGIVAHASPVLSCCAVCGFDTCWPERPCDAGRWWIAAWTATPSQTDNEQRPLLPMSISAGLWDLKHRY